MLLEDYTLIKNIYLVCFGVIVSLCVQYVLLAILTFQKKNSMIFRLVILGLFLCLLESSLVMVLIEKNIEYLLAVIGVVSFLKVQVITWLYVLRIKSLGSFFKCDFYIKYIPFIIGAAQIPIVVITFYSKNLREYISHYNYYEISAFVLSFVISVCEVIMNILLLKKLHFVLEYKPESLKKIVFHLSLASLIVVLLEIAMLFTRAFLPIDYALNPIIYAIRTYIIIQFYDNLITAVNSDIQSSLVMLSYSE